MQYVKCFMRIMPHLLSILFAFAFCSELNETVFDSNGFPRPGDIPVLNGKVIKGLRVSIREHPYIASIRRNYVHFLTGTILKKNLIITVAHPLIDVPIYELGVVVGQNYADRGTVLRTVIFVIIHEKFDPFTLQNDIAMLRLFENLLFTGAVKTIELVPKGTELNGVRAFVSGWGRCDNMGTELCLPRSSKYNRDVKIDPMLRSVSFTINIPNYYCDGYTHNKIIFQEGMICIGDAREECPVCPCMAVPGAPLVVNAFLAGLSSWGFGCGYEFDLPLVYTDIATYSEWILRNFKIQNEIKKGNITLLYKATKAYLLLKWIKETRIITPNITIRADNYVVLLDIDKRLAVLPDAVYDIRDYIEDGAYHDFKFYKYNEYRKQVAKMQQIEQLKPKLRTRPFLNKEVLGDVEFKKISNDCLDVD